MFEEFLRIKYPRNFSRREPGAERENFSIPKQD